MSGPADDSKGEAFRAQDGDANRDTLDAIFKAGGDARRAGKPLRGNPYAAGSEEREEWDAGWCATVEIDDDDDGECGYQKN